MVDRSHRKDGKTEESFIIVYLNWLVHLTFLTYMHISFTKVSKKMHVPKAMAKARLPTKTHTSIKEVPKLDNMLSLLAPEIAH